MTSQRASTHRRLAGTLAVAAFATVGVTGSVRAGTATETAVMAWLDAVSPAITIDQSNDCMDPATDAVAYRNDRIVIRAPHTVSDDSVKSAVNAALHALYPTTVDYAGPIERITFPSPNDFPIDPVFSITLNPRGNGTQQHDILGLARRLRELHWPASPDYAVSSSGHNSFYQPHGAPRWVAAPEPPRTNLTPANAPVGAGLRIGSGVKVIVYDTGYAGPPSADLPTTTKLSSSDNELVNRVLNDNDPLMVDYPHAGHGKAIAGVITTIAPGATIHEARINDRDGLATDVSAARRMAASLRTLRTPSLANYPNLIINAFATAVCDLDPINPGAVLQPIGLEAVVEAVDRFNPYRPGGMLIVASAGNMESTRPHYPAAFPTVLSVGALDGNIDADLSPWSSPSKTAPVADFSNRGSWVDVYGLGVDLPTTHVNGYRFDHDGPIIMGAARVDGTSYSAPKVAAYIAELMSTTGLRARSARDELIANGVAPLPQCGTTTVEAGVAIVLSDLTDTITDTAAPEVIICPPQ
jgi:hypothetical protein